MHGSHQTLSPQYFLKLRLVAFCGLTALMGMAIFGAELTIPIVPVGLLLLSIPISQLVLMRNLSSRSLGLLIVFDTAVLTGLLYFSGGAANPFSLIYLVHVVLAAVMLGSRWAWAMALMTTIGFSLLFVYHYPIHELHHMPASGLSVHLYGMLGSYVLVAALVAYFLSKIVHELKLRDERLQQLDANQKKLALVTSWAANAAHKLGTPLSTISLIAHELKESVGKERGISPQDLEEDLSILRSEAKRCKSTVDELCRKAGSIRGEMPVTTELAAFVADALREHEGSYVSFVHGDTAARIPPRALGVALEAIVSNAVHAHKAAKISQPVEVDLLHRGDSLVMKVRDYGDGISEEMKSTFAEPFVTDKPVGEGMGLGIYIADLVVHNLKGALVFDSESKQGTVVSLTIPLSKNSQILEEQRRVAA